MCRADKGGGGGGFSVRSNWMFLESANQLFAVSTDLMCGVCSVWCIWCVVYVVCGACGVWCMWCVVCLFQKARERVFGGRDKNTDHHHGM